MKKKYESEALMVVHQDAEGLHSLGIISDAKMKEFDEMCLIPAEKPAKKAKTAATGHARPATA
jgi:DNA-binding transcriptional regulator YiaG